MATTYTLTATVRHGKLCVRDWSRFADAVRGWRDGDVVISVERKHAHRSLQANAFYFGVCVRALSEHTGYTPDEMHELLKAKFLPKHLAIADRNGEIVGEYVIGGSTAKLNTPNFADYVRQVVTWAESLGVAIPDAETRVA